ncbi:response regulator transcription factor [Nocardioides sp.]|uniref:response regulator transcription factor n=1 Tax=Nocardioides sp. TaxID=35761 RepID=UPI00273650CA|nr:response regulator transcription factor [Nocardioides sp.]MDP3891547.1 response regulator transcription factor [Nocardioides sp.]
MRAVIAEDNPLLRDGLSRILAAHGIEVVAAVDNAVSLTKALREEETDLAVVDVRMPPTHTNEGLVAAITARAEQPGFPVLVLSQHVEALYARELLASGDGAVGYLLKDRVVDIESFVDAVRQVAGGGTVLDPEVVAALFARTGPSRRTERLTEREREVLALMAEGRSNAAIAAALFVSEKAIGKHSSNIFTKLELPMAPDDNRRVLAVLAWLDDRT